MHREVDLFAQVDDGLDFGRGAQVAQPQLVEWQRAALLSRRVRRRVMHAGRIAGQTVLNHSYSLLAQFESRAHSHHYVQIGFAMPSGTFD
jgi:hypothetical protein